MTLDLPRRFPWPTLLSVAIHGVVVAGLLYTSVHQVIEQPSPTQPIEITMVAASPILSRLRRRSLSWSPLLNPNLSRSQR